jgi:Flp pilus assembly protein TadG
MKMIGIGNLWKNECGVAAAEMALVAPILITLMFGSFELGNYFRSEHVIVKSVRDGARFAGRQAFGKYACPSTIDGLTETKIKLLTRTGQLEDSAAPAKIYGWTDADVAVTVSCPATPVTTGLYEGLSNAPRVTVTVSNVDYPSLFQSVGFGSLGLTLNASSTSAVMGI